MKGYREVIGYVYITEAGGCFVILSNGLLLKKTLKNNEENEQINTISIGNI